MSEPEQADPSVTGVVFERQTWRNVAYLLLSFVSGIAYFSFLVSGLAVGFGLTTIWVGIPILLLVAAAWWKLAAVERRVAARLIDVEIPSPAPRQTSAPWRKRITEHFGDPLTWKSLAFLFMKFPLGVVSFVLTVLVVSVAGGLLSVPFLYNFADVSVGPFAVDDPIKSAYFGCLGAFVGVFALHGLNAWTRFCGRIANRMLSPTTRPAADPVSPAERPGRIERTREALRQRLAAGSPPPLAERAAGA